MHVSARYICSAFREFITDVRAETEIFMFSECCQDWFDVSNT